VQHISTLRDESVCNEKIRIKGKAHSSPVLWIWGFCGDSHRFSCVCGIVWGLKCNPNGSPVLASDYSGSWVFNTIYTARCTKVSIPFVFSSRVRLRPPDRYENGDRHRRAATRPCNYTVSKKTFPTFLAITREGIDGLL